MVCILSPQSKNRVFHSMQSEIEVTRLPALEKKRRLSSFVPAPNSSAAKPTSSYSNNTSTPYNFSTHKTDP